MDAADLSLCHRLYSFFVWRNYGFVDEPFEPFPKRRLVTMASLLLGTCRRKQTVVDSCRVFDGCCLSVARRFSGSVCVFRCFARTGQCAYVQERAIRFCLLLCGAILGGGFNDHGNRDGSTTSHG